MEYNNNYYYWQDHLHWKRWCKKTLTIPKRSPASFTGSLFSGPSHPPLLTSHTPTNQLSLNTQIDALITSFTCPSKALPSGSSSTFSSTYPTSITNTAKKIHPGYVTATLLIAFAKTVPLRMSSVPITSSPSADVGRSSTRDL